MVVDNLDLYNVLFSCIFCRLEKRLKKLIIKKKDPRIVPLYPPSSCRALKESFCLRVTHGNNER